MKLTFQFLVASFAFSGALFAAPVLSDVTLLPHRGTRHVRVTYELSGDPAVITVDFTTNGVSIGPEKIQSLSGDVCRKVEPGERTILWDIRADWPEQRVSDGSFKAVVTAWATNSPPDYMVVDLATKSNVLFYASAESVPGGMTNDIYKTSKLVMRRVHAAGERFRMGSPAGETGRTAANEGQHWVMLSEDYYLGVFEATQGQWHQFKSTKNFNRNGETNPAESFGVSELRGTRAAGYSWPVNGHDVLAGSLFGVMRAKTGVMFDLPTEAQWEYACRAGAYDTPYGIDTNAMALAEFAWFMGNASGIIHPVGQLEANAWGFFDMHGNVAETCLDYFVEALTGPVEDPSGPDSGTEDNLNFTLRGGAGENAANLCRSAYRRAYDNDKGFYRFWGFRLWAPAVAP